ncbi:hypothetical protein [Parapedobacter koreensis]|uniref:WD40-like Beta Propeller Repeat n=1 Tax=Parapedobacter koreensis TaxID=332977 RepID=A0A1H7MPC1_9SPHI|nr:hypothetical protein [Parapedobacter koreensis]SEL12951.1 hypothetical protein SAMN05421740_103591 [Parapedobacter koreensis]
MRTDYLICALVLASMLVNCAFGQSETAFGERQAVGKITNGSINEASGLVASGENPRYFWTHNDSGDKARIFLIDDSANHKKTYYLQGIVAHDWEDIGMMERQGTHYLIVGDIGDNGAKRRSITIHVFEEPKLVDHSPTVDTIPKNKIASFTLKYEDGPRDAESLFFDPLDGRLYLISKREPAVGVYWTDLPDVPRDTLILRKTASLPLTFITAADISVDGRELLMKNLLGVFYWTRRPGESVPQMLSRPGIRLPYLPEPQGEAIAFSRDGKSYYTLSEKAFGMDVILYFYKRL